MNHEKITKFITELRKEKHLTQQEFADIIGVSNSAVSKWETGRFLPDPTLYEKIADCFGITISELIAGRKEKKNHDSKTIIFLILIALLSIISLVSISKNIQAKESSEAIYKLKIANDNIHFSGYLIQNKKTSYLIINSLLISELAKENIKDVKVYLKSDETVITKVEQENYTDNLTELFMNNFLQIEDINPHNLTLDINYFDGLKNIKNSYKVEIINIDNT